MKQGLCNCTHNKPPMTLHVFLVEIHAVCVRVHVTDMLAPDQLIGKATGGVDCRVNSLFGLHLQTFLSNGFCKISPSPSFCWSWGAPASRKEGGKISALSLSHTHIP
ncbi:UNVERIFIED_CONTAM: hypothetical protein K2H54_066048 [Gekko kuhli]